MRLNLIFVFIVLLSSVTLISAQQANYYADNYYNDIIPTYTEEDIRDRLRELNLCVPARYSSIVKSYVRTYSVTSRDKAKRILGSSVQFFPIFEQYINEKNLPQDLKYLPVVESALNPHAVSSANAVGLWQFMAATAREYGLEINGTVDERKDPHRSTQAALTFLQTLYNRYGDWALALAAYNGGPGRVNRAIKRGRSKNFWTISKYLPKETRNYVPAFIAAAYLMNHYHYHNLEANYPDLDMQMTDVARVYKTISFHDISAITGLPTYTIAALNPSYNKQIIPGSMMGNYLILPKRVMGSFLQYQRLPDGSARNFSRSLDLSSPSRHPNDHFFKSKYVVGEGEDIYQVARIFKCNAHNIKAWNGLYTMYVRPGQELTIYQPYVSADYGDPVISTPKKVVKPKVVLKKYNTVSIPGPSLNKVDTEQKARRTLTSLTSESFLYHRLTKGQSLIEVANKFPGVTLEDILSLNDLSQKKRMPKPGTRIKIKRM